MIDIITFCFWLSEYYFDKMPKGKSCAGSFEFGVVAFFVLISFLILFTNLRIKNSRSKNNKKDE
jgi:hypothetical protein